MNYAPPTLGTTNPWAEGDCDCSGGPQLEPWQRPLLSQRQGNRRQGRLGAVSGYTVNSITYADLQTAEAAMRREAGGDDPRQLLSGQAYGTHPYKPRRDGVERNDGYRADCVELVIDGERVIEAGPGRWVEARTGKPWRKRRPLQEVAR